MIKWLKRIIYENNRVNNILSTNVMFNDDFIKLKDIKCKICYGKIEFDEIPLKDQFTLLYTNEGYDILYRSICSSCVRDQKLKDLGI